MDSQVNAEPIYMTPSEVDQGFKHAQKNASNDFTSPTGANKTPLHMADSESLASGVSQERLATSNQTPGETAQEARHNQLKRTHQMQEKLRRWETNEGRDSSGQQKAIMMSSQSGVYIEEMAELDNINKEQIHRESSLLRNGEMSASLDGAKKDSQVRLKQPTRVNTIFVAVPQQEAWVVERMGKFHRVLEPGMSVLLPLFDRVKYVHSLKEIPFDLTNVRVVTQDQVILNLDMLMFLRVEDPYKASYAIEDPEFAITQSAIAELRREVSNVTLDYLLANREQMSSSIVNLLNSSGDAWGIVCLRCEIRDIQIPYVVQQALIEKAEAERRKMAAITESEGIKMAEIKVAEGQKYSVLLAAEAARAERVERAEGEAESMLLMARARAQSLALLSEALALPQGMNAASLSIAEQYVQAFGNMARASNTMILPADAASPANMIAQAMGIMGAANSATMNANIAASAQSPQMISNSGQAHVGVTNGDASSIADSLLTTTNASNVESRK